MNPYLNSLMKGAEEMLRAADADFRRDPTDANERRVQRARLLIATAKDGQRRAG